jgi:sodium transport system ATP-binding protein
MIEVRGLTKTYGKVTAARDVSSIAPNAAITTLLGANGSGKSTTLRGICGLIRPDAGDALVDGIAISRNPKAVLRRLGVFPDQFGLYGRMTAREHLIYFAHFHGLRGRTLDRAIDRVVGLLRMEDFIARRTRGFSQGQRMKVALARALIHEPPNLILDEPTRGLDVMSIRLLRETLRELRRGGTCILLSSHVMAEVHELSDLIVALSEGRVAATGAPDELIARTGAANLEDAFVSIVT